MASQHRDYEQYRRGARGDFSDQGQPGRERWGATSPRSWRSQGDGDSYTDDGNRFGGGQQSGYGRGTDFGGRGSELDERGPFESRGYGSYARDLYSDSGASRHETDWESGNAGRGLQGVYSGRGWRPNQGEGRYDPPSFGQTSESTFGRYEDDSAPRRGGFAGRGPKDYQRSDERIREEICDRMTDDDSLDASEVNIQVKQGEVTLTGTVRARGDKRRAEDLAEGVSGVREVTNNLRLSRDQNGVDLTQSTSMQVGPSTQPGHSTKTKAGTGSSAS